MLKYETQWGEPFSHRTPHGLALETEGEREKARARVGGKKSSKSRVVGVKEIEKVGEREGVSVTYNPLLPQRTDPACTRAPFWISEIA